MVNSNFLKLYTIKNFVQLYNGNKLPIYLYGASVTGCMIKFLLKEAGIEIEGFIDGDKDKVGTVFCNKNIYNVESIKKEVNIILTTSKSHINEIGENLYSNYFISNIYYFEESIIAKVKWIDKVYSIDLLSMNVRENFENEYKKIVDKYKSIEVHCMWMDRIGEMIYRYTAYTKKIKVEDKNIFRVIIPYYCYQHKKHKWANSRLFEIFSRESNFVKEDNEDFWAYVVAKHFMDLDMSKCISIDDYDVSYLKLPLYKHLNDEDITFTNDEIIEAEKKKSDLGVGKNFVIVFARDNSYLRNSAFGSGYELPMKYEYYHDASISSFYRLVKYLNDKNIQVVRGGSIAAGVLEGDNVVDITNENYDELLDLYLNSKCKCWIGTESGAALIPQMFGKRMIYINYTQIFNIYPILTYVLHESNLYIPKLYFDNKNNRYLNLYEIGKLNLQNIDPNEYEKKLGISFIDNTPEDILDLYIESELKYTGEWHEDNIEVKLQSKYNYILEQICGEIPIAPERLWKMNSKECIMPLNIGSTFLKKHSFLVDY